MSILILQKNVLIFGNIFILTITQKSIRIVKELLCLNMYFYIGEVMTKDYIGQINENITKTPQSTEEYIPYDRFGNVLYRIDDDKEFFRAVDIEPVKRKPIFSFIKRAADIILSLIGLVLCFIPIIVLSLIIAFDSKGPVFFRQERVGYMGKQFMMVKFRSMRADAEANGPQLAEKDDDRVTRVGSFMRKTRLDEIPQLWNILKGDMSIVGPRPEREYFYNEYEKYIKGFNTRLKVKPGLTGYAQVNGGYDLLPQQKLSYDIEYIKNRSLLMDLKCIFKTITIVFTHDGAR